MSVGVGGIRGTIRAEIERLERAVERLRAADAALGECEDGDEVSLERPEIGGKPITLAKSVQMALQAQGGAGPVAEVIAWVKQNYDRNAKPHSIRSTLAYLKKKGTVRRGGKNWYLVGKKQSPTGE